jgi:hypothetical protein
MASVIAGRYTAELEGEFVVFLIGMRINTWWRVSSWLPVMRAMPRMIRELGAQPELGMLGAEIFFGRTTCMIQYWRSADALIDYAHAADRQHLPAWRDFNRRARASHAVGVWHETYVVSPGRYETIYVNMPPFGLGLIGEQHQAEGRRRRARDRLAPA